MQTIRVHCFPSSDQAFASVVHDLMGQRRSRGPWEQTHPTALQTALRQTFPEAVVSERDQLATVGIEVEPLWYAFRHGELTARLGAPRRVLVVDDDDAFGEMLEAMLTQAGFDVRRARDGSEGFDLATEYVPNLILLDLAMPRASGETFVERYREMPAARAPIVVVSGVPNAAARAQAANARAVVKKPFEMDSFINLVRRLA